MRPSTLACSVVIEPARLLDVRRALAGRRVLDHRGKALADADAERRDSVAPAAAAQLVHQRRHQAGAGAAERMAERDRTAVHVELLLVDPQLLDAGEDLGGERLVQLD